MIRDNGADLDRIVVILSEGDNSVGEGLEMSPCPSIIVWDSDTDAAATAVRAEDIIKGRFVGRKKLASVRVLITPEPAIDDLGIVEIDIMQSRDPNALSLLKEAFLALCQETAWRMELDWDGAELVDSQLEYMFRDRGQTEPVVFDPDDESFERGAA